MSKTAHILAIKAGSLGDLGFGISTHPGDVHHCFTEGETWIGPRPYLEIDDSFLQPIPYIVLRDGDKVLAYTRGATTGEERLHAKVSIGFGGHVDLGDAVTDDQGVIDLAETMNIAAMRELEEELGFDPRGFATADELLNWSAVIQVQGDELVDRVHLGFVGVVDVSKFRGQLRNFSFEDTIENARWMAISEFASTPGLNIETWSALTLAALIAGTIA